MSVSSGRLSTGPELSQETSRLHQCLQSVEEVEKGMLATARSIQKKMEKVQSVLTPQQVGTMTHYHYCHITIVGN